MRCVLVLSGAMATATVAGPIDEPAARPNGPFEHHHRCHALVGADVVTAPGERTEQATLILRDGRIEEVTIEVLDRWDGDVFVAPFDYAEGVILTPVPENALGRRANILNADEARP